MHRHEGAKRKKKSNGNKQCALGAPRAAKGTATGSAEKALMQQHAPRWSEQKCHSSTNTQHSQRSRKLFQLLPLSVFTKANQTKPEFQRGSTIPSYLLIDNQHVSVKVGGGGPEARPTTGTLQKRVGGPAAE